MTIRIACPACDKAMGLKPPALGDNVRHETCRMHLEMMRAEALRIQNIMAAEEAMGKEVRYDGWIALVRMMLDKMERYDKAEGVK